MTAPLDLAALRDDLAAILVGFGGPPTAARLTVDALMPRIEQAILQAGGAAWEAAAQAADEVAAAYASPHRAGAARHVAQSIRRRAHNPACNTGGPS